MPYVPLREAIRKLGVSKDTLRKYADEGLIPSIRTPTNHRRFDCEAYIKQQNTPTLVGYCRVSSRKQLDDLDRQVKHINQIYPNIEIVTDVASGLNFKRKGLNSLLERLLQGDRISLVVTYRDRLARFGFDLLKYLFEYNHGEILVLNSDVETSREQELTSDLLAILHHFSCRMHGSRSYKNKKDSIISHSRASECIQTMARDFKICLQQNNRTSESP